MIKLTAIESRQGHRLYLRFSDGASGILDFREFVEADTEMTSPLRDAAFFDRYFIELGALAWPNCLDFSAESLVRRLRKDGNLTMGQKVA